MKQCPYCESTEKIWGSIICDEGKMRFTAHKYFQFCPMCGRSLNENVQADLVDHPAHYTQGGIECIDALKAATTGLDGIEAVCTANAIKYLWRWKHKNGIEDIKKAIWYLERLEKEVEND